MITYTYIKVWATDHRPHILLVAMFVAIFFVGVGVGKFTNTSPTKTISNYSNYSTKQATTVKEAPAPVVDSQAPAPTLPIEAPVGAETAPQVLGASTNCVVKGTKSKIYHVKGGAFYDRVTKPEKCFATEEEARSSGYRKSSR